MMLLTTASSCLGLLAPEIWDYWDSGGEHDVRNPSTRGIQHTKSYREEKEAEQEAQAKLLKRVFGIGEAFVCEAQFYKH